VDGIGERLKEERLRNGWSQKDLARESKTNVDTISGIETGQHEPRPSTLRKLAEALDIEVRDLFEEPALSGKAEAPEAGPPSVIDLVLDAAQRQVTADQQAIARSGSSGRPQFSTVRFENEALRSLLEHPHGDVAETLVDLARRYVELEQELAQLREEREREAAQASDFEATYEEATEEFNQRHYGPSLIAQGWDRLVADWTRRLEEGNFDQESLQVLVKTLENVATGMQANVANERKELVARYGVDAAPDMSLLRPSINRLGLLVGEIQKETEKAGVPDETRDNLVNLAGHFQKEAS